MNAQGKRRVRWLAWRHDGGMRLNCACIDCVAGPLPWKWPCGAVGAHRCGRRHPPCDRRLLGE